MTTINHRAMAASIIVDSGLRYLRTEVFAADQNLCVRGSTTWSNPLSLEIIGDYRSGVASYRINP